MPAPEMPFGEALTIDEIEQQISAGESAAADEDVPEAYRGKSPKEIIAIAESARGALNEKLDVTKIAAEAAARAAGSMSAPPPPPPAKDDGPAELTRDQLKELYDEDPMKALEVMEQQMLHRVEKHFDSRIAPMTDGIATQAENWARQEFPEEFELFGDDIQKLVSNVGNKGVFTQKQAWEDAVAYVRGKKGNLERLIEHRSKGENRDAARSARDNEARSAGFNGRNTGGNTVRSTAAQDAAIAAEMDDMELAIANKFIDDGTFKNMQEYKLWARRGGA